MPRQLVRASDQHLDSPIAPKLYVAIGANTDPVCGHPCFDQRIANDLHTAITQIRIARIHAARIRGGVDSDLQRRIPLHIDCNLRNPICFGRLEFSARVSEPEIAVRGPAGHDTNSALCANLAGRALRATRSGRAHGPSNAGRGAALPTRVPGFAARPGGAGMAGGAGRAFQCGATNANLSHWPFRTGGTLCTDWAGEAKRAITSNACLAACTLFASGTWRALHTGATAHDGTGCTCRPDWALRSGVPLRAYFAA